jgi:hypothetical protein
LQDVQFRNRKHLRGLLMFVIYLYLRSFALLGYILYVSAKQKGYASFDEYII